MSSIINEIKSVARSMNKLSKNVIKYGTSFIAFLFLSGLVTYLLAGRLGNYYVLKELSENFFICARDCLAAIYIPALFIDILFLAKKIDEEEQ